MPIYEYTCPNCQHVFEEWLKVSETTEHAPCPKCGCRARHIISNTAFVLKGGGWYVTDYGYRKGASEDGQAAGGSEQNASPSPAAAAPDQPASGAASSTSA